MSFIVGFLSIILSLYFHDFLDNNMYSSWILANPKATTRLIGLSILTVSHILLFNPLKKQLSLCLYDKPLNLFDKTPNWAFKTSTYVVCFNLVKSSIESLYIDGPKWTCKALRKVSQVKASDSIVFDRNQRTLYSWKLIMLGCYNRNEENPI